MIWQTDKKENKISYIERLYIEPTSACNLSCKMCFRHSWLDEAIGSMSDETFENIYEYIKEYTPNTVFFGGMGEPLIHKNICSMIKKSSQFCKNTELISNGTCLTEELAENLLKSGLTRLWISMDGFSAEEYEKIRLGGRFKQITDNIKKFNELRKGTQAKLGITFVVMEENVHQLKLINDFADLYDVDLINISHAIPAGKNEAARDFYQKTIPVGKMHRLTDEYTPKPIEYCPFVEEKMCFIKWNGDIIPCMQLLHSSKTYMFEVEREVFSHNFGNVNQTSLYDSYNSAEFKTFRERVLNFDFPTCTICYGCELRESNLEDCMFNQKPTCGACLWATGKVFCP
ncbi:MAG: radical SAM protein [Clostridia bacterium]|nr:radical SAM protein [Clostridia bacterium]